MVIRGRPVQSSVGDQLILGWFAWELPAARLGTNRDIDHSPVGSSAKIGELAINDLWVMWEFAQSYMGLTWNLPGTYTAIRSKSRSSRVAVTWQLRGSCVAVA
jgi:hypothetical protein